MDEQKKVVFILGRTFPPDYFSKIYTDDYTVYNSYTYYKMVHKYPQIQSQTVYLATLCLLLDIE